MEKEDKEILKNIGWLILIWISCVLFFLSSFWFAEDFANKVLCK